MQTGSAKHLQFITVSLRFEILCWGGLGRIAAGWYGKKIGFSIKNGLPCASQVQQTAIRYDIFKCKSKDLFGALGFYRFNGA
ncbi:hypothetical protein LNQ82_10000 [Conchiformibius steedae DSM 2580]|uniref:Uncharacterized protein n=1 Tax=Conchiformibius steedae DSM 2580 TaxID=1121352 RepID=A0AAE9HVW3_9NEIS|nr:hypothetical protein [Conchiformibius steedae]URD67496.1 hypothetical protein LNQ82_10000 [Conchiformibius steedae DSM 2580]